MQPISNSSFHRSPDSEFAYAKGILKGERVIMRIDWFEHLKLGMFGGEMKEFAEIIFHEQI